MDLAYFCYSAIAAVPSNGEGFQIAVLLSPEELTPTQGADAGIGLPLAESDPSCDGQCGSGGCESVHKGLQAWLTES